MIDSVNKAFRIQLLPLIVGFVVLAVIIGARSWLVESQIDDNLAVRRAFELDRHLTATFSLVQDAETGQRGYLLTGEGKYLAPFESAAAALPGELDTVRTAIASHPERVVQFAELQSAVEDKLSELKTVIALQKNGDSSGALTVVRTDRGRALMDRIRGIVETMRRDENAQLQSRLAQADRASGQLRLASIMALLAVFALGAFGIVDARRRLKAIVGAHKQLTSANRALSEEIATRQAAESQVRQMQKMEAVGQLTGGIAHDFNNMLAVILSAMNLIQRKLSRGESDIGKFVDAAIDATNRAANLTGRLLAFSRQQPLAPQVVDANRMVSGMSDLLRRTLGEAIEIETVLAGGLWKTHVDTSQLENAVINLAVNARDAMPDGGRLTIETANCHLDDAYSTAHLEVPAGQYVLVAVTDTGTGMPAEVIAKAFEPFFTTKPVNKGTGLGLSQVFGFVKQSGGHVKIYSEPGQGTTVKIYLRRYFGTDEVVESDEISDNPTGTTSETILVVEDDDRVRAGTVDSLRELGYTVVHASDGADALRKLDAAPSVSLLFTDIVMPVMNGRKLAEEAVAKRPGLKVLYTTGFTKNAVVHNGVLDHGVNFLAKPFTIDQLARKVRDVIDS